MKKRLIAGIALMLALVCLCAHAFAADADPIKISIELSETNFPAPKEITVSIQVTNTGDTDMPGPVTVYYPNGKQIEEFGTPTLAAGQSKSCTFTWQVTQKQLDSGKIVFPFKYPVFNESGELLNKTRNMGVGIIYTGAVASVEINRTVTPTTAGKGQQVAVTYDVVNSGNIDITDIVIKENKSISSKTGTIDAIAAGEKGSYTFYVNMGTKDLTSQATITYKANGKTQEVKKEAVTIKYGEVYLKGTLKADKKGGLTGDTVALTLTLQNTGKTDYTNVTVTDPVLGEVFSGQTVKAGEKLPLETTVTISGTQDYQFRITAQDAEGNTIETSSDRLTLTAIDPSQKIALQVNITADRTEVYELPGVVRFTVDVTNLGATDVSDVTVYAVDQALYTFETIPAGATKTFVRDVAVSMAGQYQFVAKCRNQLNEVIEFTSNVLPIGYTRPTAAPTAEPVITPVPPAYATMPRTDDLPAYYGTVENVLGTAKLVLAALAGVCLVLFAIGAVRHGQAKRASARAIDHLEGGVSSRDYEHRPSKHSRNSNFDVPEQDDSQFEQVNRSEEASDVMAETLAKLYDNQPAEQAQPEVTVEEVAPQTDDTTDANA